MAKYTKRVVLNRAKLTAVRLILADGLFEVGRHILDAADPPDRTPFGVGLVTAGGGAAYVDGKKVAGTTINGQQVGKPRAAKLPRPGVVAIIGYGFPGRFVHNGTIHHRANPFLARARDRIVPIAGELMNQFCRTRLARLR